MDTNRMRYFLSLARTGSITKAAELHHISAAAFSKAMKVFETEVGQPLTIAQGRGLILTDYAKSLVPDLEQIIRQIEAIRDGKNKVSATDKSIRVATFEVFSTHFMARAMKEYFADYKCELHEMIPGRMEEAVANGKADLAITYIPIPHPELDFLKVKEIEMGIYGSTKFIGLGDYSAAPFAAPINPVEGSPDKVRGLDGWPDDALPRNIRYHVQMLETALGLCREKLAIAYLPKFVANLYNEVAKPSFRLEALPLPSRFPKTKTYVYLIKRKSDQEGTEAKKMAQAIRKICG